MTRTVLVTGATGQLGAALRRAARPDGCAALAPDRAAVDLADPDARERPRWASGAG